MFISKVLSDPNPSPNKDRQAARQLRLAIRLSKNSFRPALGRTVCPWPTLYRIGPQNKKRRKQATTCSTVATFSMTDLALLVDTTLA